MDRLWVVVLAGGEGSRIRSMTRAPDGTPVPKQFCRLRDGMSLFHRAVARGLSLTAGARVVPVVQSHHRAWWKRDLRGLSPEILIVQRECRGTAHAVYRAAAAIAERDPEAVVLVLPSDHVVDDEPRFRAAAASVCREARAHRELLVLLGIAHREPDPEYGWIVPAADGESDSRRVLAFVEKPTRDQAMALLRRGALVNAMIVAATAGPLLELFERSVPDLTAEHRSGKRCAVRAGWDFSRDFLSRTTTWQRVMRAPTLGWCDLGTPERLRLWMESHEEFFWWADDLPRARKERPGIVQPAVG